MIHIIIATFMLCAFAFMLGAMTMASLMIRYIKRVILGNTSKQLHDEEGYNEDHINGRIEVAEELVKFFNRK